jgi:uncharacterized protein RhaS with RHS repeats
LTGLYYLRARYYNTGIGRFTQEDVIYNEGLNLYAYCSSNPVMYADPSGYKYHKNQGNLNSCVTTKSAAENSKSGSKGGTDVRNRQGRPVLATEKTLDMALDPETYANTIAEKYGINLRGSGQSITIKYNGRTTAANPYVIEIGSDALVSEEELANTIAHELNHARDFIRGGIAPESSAYSSGNALSDYIMGGR